MNWLQRKVYLYNVTFGLYMLDWWERYLFRNQTVRPPLNSLWIKSVEQLQRDTLIIVMMLFLSSMGSRLFTELFTSYIGYTRTQPSVDGHPWVNIISSAG